MFDLWAIGFLLVLALAAFPAVLVSRLLPRLTPGEFDLPHPDQIQLNYERRAKRIFGIRWVWLLLLLYVLVRGFLLVGVEMEHSNFTLIFGLSLFVAAILGLGSGIVLRVIRQNASVRSQPQFADCVSSGWAMTLPLVRLAVPLALISVSFFSTGDTDGLWWIAAGLVSFVGLHKVSLAVLTRQRIQIPMDSAFGQRIAEVVEQFGLHPKRIVLLKSFVANGYALPDGTILLTTGLRHVLSDEETLAVLAHELSHVRDRDARKIQIRRLSAYLGSAALVFGLAYGMAWIGVPSEAWVLFVSLSLGPVLYAALLSSAWFSRKQEFKCDADAKQMGMGEELARGLEKLYRYNRVAHRWVGFDRILLSHPSLEERLAALRRS